MLISVTSGDPGTVSLLIVPPPYKPKLLEDWTMSYSSLFSQHPAGCLTSSLCSGNICWLELNHPKLLMNTLKFKFHCSPLGKGILVARRFFFFQTSFKLSEALVKNTDSWAPPQKLYRWFRWSGWGLGICTFNKCLSCFCYNLETKGTLYQHIRCFKPQNCPDILDSALRLDLKRIYDYPDM